MLEVAEAGPYQLELALRPPSERRGVEARRGNSAAGRLATGTTIQNAWRSDPFGPGVVIGG